MTLHTRHITLHTWHSTLDTGNLTLGTWQSALDTWYSTHDTWHSALDTWHSTLSTRHLTLHNRHLKKRSKKSSPKILGKQFSERIKIDYQKQVSTKISTCIICRFWIVQRRYWMGKIHQNVLWNPRISCTRGENLYIKIII